MSRDARAALAQFSDDALQRLILELGRYALSVSRRLYWRTGNAQDLPQGETIDSIVSKALTKVLSGERQWNPLTAPDFKKYLMGVIDSLLNHLAEHKDNTTLRPLPQLADGHDAPISSAADPAAWHPDAPDPETALLWKEQATYEDRLLQHLLTISQDDPLVVELIHAMQDGYGKPADIAEFLQQPVAEIYKAVKRLDRKLLRVRQDAEVLKSS